MDMSLPKKWNDIRKLCFSCASTGLQPGDIVAVPDLYDYGIVSELKMVISISRGHTQTKLQFLYLLPSKIGMREEMYLPHKEWLVLVPDDEH
jgi:hypothetical protein